MRWKRYLESRKAPAEQLAAGTGSAGRVAIMAPDPDQESPQGPAPLKDTVHLLEFLNVLVSRVRSRVTRWSACLAQANTALTHTMPGVFAQEGARVGELSDLRQRVIAHLALIVLDAAQDALNASVDDWVMPTPAPAFLHKYGERGSQPCLGAPWHTG